MLTAAVLILAVLLLLAVLALGVVGLLWRAAAGHAAGLEDLVRAQHRKIRHQQDRIDGYRAELDALSITPTAATAALTPDDPSLLPAEIEQWLRERNDR